MKYRLGIVIPAYKLEFLELALESLAGQTNKDFRVYISDDGSKENLKGCCEKFNNNLFIVYKRFDDNLGNKNLTSHWDRSIKLVQEEWVWLFSDDDILDKNCVQALYNAFDKTKEKYILYRFNIQMINTLGDIICIKEPHPILESGHDFLLRRLDSKSLSAAIEYIFRKKTFNEKKGFVNFPLAYCSDDASWINFTDDQPIYTITESLVFWRSSGINISSKKGLINQKISAKLDFAQWIKQRYPNEWNFLSAKTESWFFENLQYLNGSLRFTEKIQLSKKLNVYFGKSTIYYLLRLFINKKTNC